MYFWAHRPQQWNQTCPAYTVALSYLNVTCGYKNVRKIRLKERAELTQKTQLLSVTYVLPEYEPDLCDVWLTLKKSPSQTTWMFLQMSRTCGKAASLVWYSILLLLTDISQAELTGWTYMNHSLCQPIGKKNSKIQNAAEKKCILAKKNKKTQSTTKQPDRFTLQAWRAMLKVSPHCWFWHCHFRCWDTQGLQFATSDLWALASPPVVMMQTGLWKAIKLLAQEHNKTHTWTQTKVWKFDLYKASLTSIKAFLQPLTHSQTRITNGTVLYCHSPFLVWRWLCRIQSGPDAFIQNT